MILIPVDEAAQTVIGCHYFLPFLGNIYQKIVKCMLKTNSISWSGGHSLCFSFTAGSEGRAAVHTPSQRLAPGLQVESGVSAAAAGLSSFALGAARSPRRLVPALRSAASRRVRFNRDREGWEGEEGGGGSGGPFVSLFKMNAVRFLSGSS